MTDISPAAYRRCGCTDPTTGRRLGNSCPQLIADPDHGSWYFAVQITDRNGRRQRVRQGGYGSATDAETARQAMTIQKPDLVLDHGYTVAGWLHKWGGTLPLRVRASTAASYTGHVTNILTPAIGHHRLGALTRHHVQTMFDDLASWRTRNGTAVTTTTLHRIRATLRRALNVAIAHGLIVDNPARMLDLPAPRHHRPVTWSRTRVQAWRDNNARPPIAVWTPEHLAEFLTAVHDDPLFALWWLAALRGLRRGELLGLRWIDVDLDDATLTVNQALIDVAGTVRVEATKTLAGNRTITLDPTTVTILAAHRSRQRHLHANENIAFDERGFVFTRPDGRPIRPDWLTHRFATLVAGCGLPPVRLHDLRHGAAMNALHGQSTIHTVQHLLGHTSYAFTADIYGAVPDTLARAEARTSAAVVLGALRRTRSAAPGRADGDAVDPRHVRLGRRIRRSR
jgi:integrase